MQNCYCHSKKAYKNCCQPFIEQPVFLKTPEQLMRSRYTAFTLHEADYLYHTTYISERKFTSKDEILNWSKRTTWLKLEVIEAVGNKVTFKAHYLDETLEPKSHYEKSTFKQINAIWYYVNSEFFD
jgi:SEC-C motif-containing protein